MSKESVRESYNASRWGKLLLRFGYEPYDTESAARNVAIQSAALLENIESIADNALHGNGDRLSGMKEILRICRG